MKKIYQERQELYCEADKVVKSLSTMFKIDQGTCWICWMRLTGENLHNWWSVYASNMDHPTVCPVCGYSKWKGRVWFPFRFQYLKSIPNPSRRS